MAWVQRFFDGFKGSRFKVQGCGAAHFVILSGEKRRMLENGLSEV